MPVTSSVVFKEAPENPPKVGDYVQYNDAFAKKVVCIVYNDDGAFVKLLVLASKSQYFSVGDDLKLAKDIVYPFYGELKIEVT